MNETMDDNYGGEGRLNIPAWGHGCRFLKLFLKLFCFGTDDFVIAIKYLFLFSFYYRSGWFSALLITRAPKR